MADKLSAGGMLCLNCEAENDELRNKLSQLQGCYDDAVASLREKAIELEMANRNTRILLQNLALAEKRAVYDNLTGLFTRYEMEVQIKHHFSLLSRAECLLKNKKVANIDDENFSILFVDLNDFKIINDSCGHQYGDRALSIFANFLKQSFRETDIISRWGGDEFVVLLPGICYDRAVEIVIAVKDKLEGVFMQCPDSKQVPIRASFGVASTSDAHMAHTLEEIIGVADKAMYLDKKK
ncbi:MAG: Diguanylate cyclase/phosphodiesterase [Parcubacteria group bacterium GW2011_GWC1_42_11]|nr:MAG: Diguanylate cyclase/phosphodiesterase [Parcubacteria group bacterium GW2011_GWC1_42_11]